MHLVLKNGTQTLFEGDHASGSETFQEELREKIHRKGLEEVLDLTFEALERRGYALPRVYLNKGGSNLLLSGRGLPSEMRRMEVRSPLLETIVRDKMIYVNDACRQDSSLQIEKDPMLLVQEKGLIASYFPLVDKLDGVLVANYHLSLNPEEIKLFRRVAYDLGSAMSVDLERDQSRKEVLQLKADLEDLKKRDNATGLYNKQTFHKDLARALNLVHNQKKNYYLLLADIDNLKKFNDQFGHAKGDVLVADVGEYWRSLPELYGYRVGGDKFALIVPAVGKRDDMYMLNLARSIKKNIQKLPVPRGAIPITVSLGLALSDLLFIDGEAWYAKGNSALAEAKKEKNCGIYLIESAGQTVQARV